MAKSEIITDIQQCDQSVRFEATNKIPLWNDDGWVESWAHKRAISGVTQDMFWTDDIFGRLVVSPEELDHGSIATLFAIYQQLAGESYGYACLRYLPLVGPMAGKRLDIYINQSSWACNKKTLEQYAIPFDPSLPLDQRPTLFSTWRSDFSIRTPMILLITQEPLHLVGIKNHYEKVLW